MNSDGYYQQYYRPGRRQDHQRRNIWMPQKPGMHLPQPNLPDPCHLWTQDMMGPPTAPPSIPVQPLEHGYQTPHMAQVNPPQPTVCCENSSPPQTRHQYYPGPYVWLLMIPIGYRADGTYGPLCPFPPFSPFPEGLCEEPCPYVAPSGSYSHHPDQSFG